MDYKALVCELMGFSDPKDMIYILQTCMFNSMLPERYVQE